MTRVVVLAGMMAGLLYAGTAQAAPVVYSWTGFGTNVPGSSKCVTPGLSVRLKW